MTSADIEGSSMFRRDTPAEAEFRNEVRSWLEATLPVSLRDRTTRPPPAELMPWYKTLSRKGWIAPHWPKQYGGMGATLNEQVIMTEELARIGAPHLPVQGLNHIGPILMEFGSEAQKNRHLPPILEGSVIWAQGYSEPGAGSDLASVATRATLSGDHFVVNGSKIWTTWGHHSDWMFALVRTDPDAQPRHAGISFLLIDLHSPGIRIRPILTIASDDEFSEVFFDDVVVPAENLVGKLNDGWRIANALLVHERLGTSNPQFALQALDRIKLMARATGIIADPAFQDRLAAASINVTALSAMFSHAVELTNNDRNLGPEASVIKIFGSELLQSLNELLIEAAGGYAAMEQPVATSFGTVDVAVPFLFSRRVTIYGGSSEIQRNVLARRVLNLPP
ncbi:MAG: acyl-CoA dehydrogenase family protein [Bradyrhizobiaceae bacterium]|nr:acyl-CoA dehydrogenase family protein [Bradyrhizobiaceae bacterium]